MKKSTLLVASLFFVSLVFSQDKMFKQVNTYFVLPGQMEKAKSEIDKVLADPAAQAKAEGWLWKARVYGALFSNPQTKEKYKKAGSIAYESFERYMQMDPSAKIMTETNSVAGLGLTVVDDIYQTYGNMAAECFNSKDWVCALENYGYSAKMGEFITMKNWKNNNQVIDTLTVFFAAYSAQSANKLELAEKYYLQLADKRVAEEKYELVYDYLTVYYRNTKNKAAFDKYIQLAKELYPKNNSLWHKRELDYIDANSSYDEKEKMYNEAKASGKMGLDDYILYGEMFSTIKKEDKDKMDSTKKEDYRRIAIECYKKAFELDNTNGLLAYNAGLLNYFEFDNLSDRLSNTRRALQDLNTEWSNAKPEKDPKKKAALEAAHKATTDSYKAKMLEIDKPLILAADAAIEWFEKAVPVLKAKTNRNREEKNRLNDAIDDLATLYSYKREKARGKDPQAFDKYEAKFKEYDAQHDKY